MASDFLQGVQVGANLFAQAKQLQEARQRSMMQAQQMLQNIRAARAMEQYRNEQMALARAEEERKAQEWQQQQALEQQRQQFAPFVQRRFQELKGATPRGLEPGAGVEETDPLLRRAVLEGLIQHGGRPQDVVSMLGQDETTRRRMLDIDAQEQRFVEREQRMRDEFNKKLEETKAGREQRAETAESEREWKMKQTAISSQDRLVASLRKSLDLARNALLKDPEQISSLESQLEKEQAELDSMRGYKPSTGSMTPQTSFMWDNKIRDLVPVE